MTNPKSKIQNLKWLAPVILSVFLIWLTIKSCNKGSDFAAYYAAGEMIRMGEASQLYSIPALTAREQATPFGHFTPFCHLPLEAALLAPFTFFSYPTAYVLWCFFNFLCVGVSCWILARWRGKLPGLQFWAVLAVPLASIAISGQDTGFLLLVYSWAFVSLCHDKDESGGIALGLALFRYGVTIPFLILLLPLRRWVALMWAAAGGVFLLFWSELIVGPHFARDYLNMLRFQSGPSDLARLNEMPSLRGLFGAAHPTAYLTVALGILALGMWAVWSRPGQWVSIPSFDDVLVLPPFGIAFAIGIPVALAVDPHGFAYGWVLLAIQAAILEGDLFAGIFYVVPFTLAFGSGVYGSLGPAVVVLLVIAFWSWRALSAPRIAQISV